MSFIRISLLLFLFSCKTPVKKVEGKTAVIRDKKGKIIQVIETGVTEGPFKDTNAASLPFRVITYYDSLGRPVSVKSIKSNDKTLETFYYGDSLSALWIVWDLGRSPDMEDTAFVSKNGQLNLIKEQRLNRKGELIYEYTETNDPVRKCNESIYDSVTGNWNRTNNCR
jgi:hypothetical protein